MEELSHLMVTSVPKSMQTVAKLVAIYSQRWLIEMAFRAWKQAGNLAKALTFHIPAVSINDVRESGKPATEATGVTHHGQKGSTQILRLHSGCYQFTSASAPAVQ